MASRFSVEAVFKGIDKISKPVSRMRKNIAMFARTSKARIENLGRSVSDLSKKFSKILAVGATAGFLALNVAIADTARTGIDFEQTIVSAAAKFPGEIKKGTKEFNLLEQAAKETGKRTEFTATQSANALNFLAMAGFNAQQSIAALPGVVDLATAAGLDLDRATDIATDTLGAFGLVSKDTAKLALNLARVNDVLAKTSVTSNTTMEQLFESVKSGAPDFAAAGQSIETFSSLVGIMASNSKKGEKSGTVLRNVMARLADPTKEASRILKRLNIATADQSGNFRDIIDIIEDLEKGLKGLGTKQKTLALSTIFGVEAQGGINILLQAGSKRLREYRKEIEAAEGSSTKMAATMRDTLQGRINSLKSAFEGLQLTLFDFEKGPLSGLVEKITEIVRNIDAFIINNKAFGESLTVDINNTIVGAIKVFGLFIAAIVALKTVVLLGNAAFITFKATLIIFKTIMIALKGALIIAKIAMAAFNLVMSLNPILAISVLIAGLIVSLLLLIKNWDKVKIKISQVWDSITAKIKGSLDKIKGFLALVTDPFKELFAGISGLREKFSVIFGKEETEGEPERKPGIITPEEQISRSITERITEGKSTLTVKDETGRAELTTEKKGGPEILLATSGGF